MLKSGTEGCMLQQWSPSIRIYLLLIVLLAVLAVASIFLPQSSYGAMALDQQMPASKPIMALVTAGIMLILYGGLGLLGLWLTRKLNFVALWDPTVTNRQRFLLPALIGLGLGLFFIVADLAFQQWHSVGALPHPPFPISIVASATAGIGEELIFRLFFIPFWLWFISSFLLRGRWPNEIFWGVSILSALVFALGHLPAVMLVLDFEDVAQIPAALMIEIVLLNGILSLFAAYYFRQYGFLAAVGIHFWTDVVWHVIWGLFAN